MKQGMPILTNLMKLGDLTMEIIKRLRELEAAALVGDPKLLGETTASMEFIDFLVDNSAQLLDRLEKLETVLDAAIRVVDTEDTNSVVMVGLMEAVDPLRK